MKILLLSQFFSPTRGGGEHLFFLLAKNLAENNHLVWVVTNKIEGENYQSHENIKMVFVPPVLKYQGGLPPSIKDNIQYLINALKVGKKIIKENNIEIIHSNNFTPALTGGLLSFLTSKIHITSVWDIFTLCGCDYWKKWVKQAGISKINQFIGPVFEKLVIKARCDAFHTISEASKEDLLKFGAKKPIYIIPPTIEDIPERENALKQNQFIYLGRLVFYKNIEVLIDAMKIVKNENEDIKLIIAGGGPQFNQIKKKIKEDNLDDNIIIKNYVEPDEKFTLIAESNAMVFPSTCEGFGLVILESFSQNRPVMVSNLSPMKDIIEDGQTGVIVDPKDAIGWAKQMIYLSKNTEISNKMGKKGNKILKENYSQSQMYKKMIRMYEDVLKSKIF